ncbi:17179_t:CDS:2 [Funneliformis caledonium]|uniref:17179_t:CDS:1 n=1 Tax=Funneliformis caledonium TaxID=1117310 RepID=A0A9N9GPX8_9GLOM|nr:17179_t:CDS:2 [Funneliformis caledonium]
MASTSRKRAKRKDTSHLSKNNKPQWIPNTGKTSFVWKFFQAKTDGRAYCRYIDNNSNDEGECNYCCIYKSQTSSMIYHIQNVHKEYGITPYKEPKQQELRYAVADWVVTDGFPFSVVQGQGFKRMINKVNPEFISPCYATLKRDIGCGYKIAIELMKDHIKKTCTYASITADLWTSRAKTGYIGITCHWLTQEMKLYDILVCVEQISYPHTGNMLKAIREWDGVNCVACSAHTLQLCVLKGLKEIKPYLNKYAKLNQFFESPKQMESDNQNEEENIYKPLKILRTVTEVPTRWGSKLASWK